MPALSLEDAVDAALDERKLKPYSARAARFCARTPQQDAKINILVGSIRSSKTWATFPKILQLCKYRVAGHKVITGISKAAIYQNVLTDLFEIIGEGNYSFNRQSGALSINGCPWLVIGARDEGSEKYIRGLTIGACVSDELVLMPQSFYKMLISRMSPDNARFYATTNPDSPYHWVKKEVLDNPHLSFGLNGADLWWQTWNLDDNPNISDARKELYKRQYKGIFADRFLAGKWVLASGSIYRDVLSEDTWYDDNSRPIGLLSQHGHSERWIAVDTGTQNAQVYLDIYDQGDQVFVEHEYYWSGRDNESQKTNGQYAHELIHGDGKSWPGFPSDQRLWPGVLIDPSAASFKAELLARGVFVMDANNEVEDGIRRVSAMLGNKKLKIHKRCVNTKKELETYAWDEKKTEVGKEVPVKSHDHAPDAIRYYVHTRINDWRLAA